MVQTDQLAYRQRHSSLVLRGVEKRGVASGTNCPAWRAARGVEAYCTGRTTVLEGRQRRSSLVLRGVEKTNTFLRPRAAHVTVVVVAHTTKY
jgi:hypothetical protein